MVKFKKYKYPDNLNIDLKFFVKDFALNIKYEKEERLFYKDIISKFQKKIGNFPLSIRYGEKEKEIITIEDLQIHLLDEIKDNPIIIRFKMLIEKNLFIRKNRFSTEPQDYDAYDIDKIEAIRNALINLPFDFKKDLLTNISDKELLLSDLINEIQTIFYNLLKQIEVYEKFKKTNKSIENFLCGLFFKYIDNYYNYFMINNLFDEEISQFDFFNNLILTDPAFLQKLIFTEDFLKNKKLHNDIYKDFFGTKIDFYHTPMKIFCSRKIFALYKFLIVSLAWKEIITSIRNYLNSQKIFQNCSNLSNNVNLDDETNKKFIPENEICIDGNLQTVKYIKNGEEIISPKLTSNQYDIITYLSENGSTSSKNLKKHLGKKYNDGKSIYEYFKGTKNLITYKNIIDSDKRATYFINLDK